MIISIASGKGGTGKTLVATSLALSLKDSHEVVILDCDVEEPNDHILLKPVITGSEPVNMLVPRVAEDKCNYKITRCKGPFRCCACSGRSRNLGYIPCYRKTLTRPLQSYTH